MTYVRAVRANSALALVCLSLSTWLGVPLTASAEEPIEVVLQLPANESSTTTPAQRRDASFFFAAGDGVFGVDAGAPDPYALAGQAAPGTGEQFLPEGQVPEPFLLGEGKRSSRDDGNVIFAGVLSPSLQIGLFEWAASDGAISNITILGLTGDPVFDSEPAFPSTAFDAYTDSGVLLATVLATSFREGLFLLGDGPTEALALELEVVPFDPQGVWGGGASIFDPVASFDSNLAGEIAFVASYSVSPVDCPSAEAPNPADPTCLAQADTFKGAFLVPVGGDATPLVLSGDVVSGIELGDIISVQISDMSVVTIVAENAGTGEATYFRSAAGQTEVLVQPSDVADAAGAQSAELGEIRANRHGDLAISARLDGGLDPVSIFRFSESDGVTGPVLEATDPIPSETEGNFVPTVVSPIELVGLSDGGQIGVSFFYDDISQESIFAFATVPEPSAVTLSVAAVLTLGVLRRLAARGARRA